MRVLAIQQRISGCRHSFAKRHSFSRHDRALGQTDQGPGQRGFQDRSGSGVLRRLPGQVPRRGAMAVPTWLPPLRRGLADPGHGNERCGLVGGQGRGACRLR
jgi:hypothetical protein